MSDLQRQISKEHKALPCDISAQPGLLHGEEHDAVVLLGVVGQDGDDEVGVEGVEVGGGLVEEEDDRVADQLGGNSIDIWNLRCELGTSLGTTSVLGNYEIRHVSSLQTSKKR